MWPITHDALDLTIPDPPDMGCHCTETLLMPSGGQDWRPVRTCSPHWCWHLVATEARTVGKWALWILPECFLVTARKRSLRRLWCVSVHRRGGGVLFQHALQVVAQHVLQQVSKGVVSQHTLWVSRPTPKGEIEGDLAGGGSPGPHPRGKFRGIWSRPTPKGEV